MEPKDYFADIKAAQAVSTDKELESRLDTINQMMLNAHSLGQKNLLHRLVFTRETILLEQTLLGHGISKYIPRDKIEEYIGKVQPKNSVKIIELDRFPRAIPAKNAKEIHLVKSLGIFHEFVVVFTDFTKSKYDTPAEKAMVQRNRDPIVFGYFRHEKTNMVHDRFYLVTDWEDEFCDLTFDRLIDRMGALKIEPENGRISTDEKYLTRIAKAAKIEMDSIEVGRERFPRPAGRIRRFLRDLLR